MYACTRAIVETMPKFSLCYFTSFCLAYLVLLCGSIQDELRVRVCQQSIVSVPPCRRTTAFAVHSGDGMTGIAYLRHLLWAAAHLQAIRKAHATAIFIIFFFQSLIFFNPCSRTFASWRNNAGETPHTYMRIIKQSMPPYHRYHHQTHEGYSCLPEISRPSGTAPRRATQTSIPTTPRTRSSRLATGSSPPGTQAIESCE